MDFTYAVLSSSLRKIGFRMIVPCLQKKLEYRDLKKKACYENMRYAKYLFSESRYHFA